MPGGDFFFLQTRIAIPRYFSQSCGAYFKYIVHVHVHVHDILRVILKYAPYDWLKYRGMAILVCRKKQLLPGAWRGPVYRRQVSVVRTVYVHNVMVLSARVLLPAKIMQYERWRYSARIYAHQLQNTPLNATHYRALHALSIKISDQGRIFATLTKNLFLTSYSWPETRRHSYTRKRERNQKIVFSLRHVQALHVSQNIRWNSNVGKIEFTREC